MAGDLDGQEREALRDAVAPNRPKRGYGIDLPVPWVMRLCERAWIGGRAFEAALGARETDPVPPPVSAAREDTERPDTRHGDPRTRIPHTHVRRDDRTLSPIVGEIYTDYAGRDLEVLEVTIGDPYGREVIGLLQLPDRRERRVRYSCTLSTWAEIWRDKLPPIPIEDMRIG
jgi:hypothetical protein